MEWSLEELKEEALSRDTLWALAGFGAAVLGAVSARAVLKAGWKAALHEDPPQNPIAPDVQWKQALLWGVLTGAVVGMARVASRRGAASAWRRWVGDLP